MNRFSLLIPADFIVKNFKGVWYSCSNWLHFVIKQLKKSPAKTLSSFRYKNQPAVKLNFTQRQCTFFTGGLVCFIQPYSIGVFRCCGWWLQKGIMQLPGICPASYPSASGTHRRPQNISGLQPCWMTAYRSAAGYTGPSGWYGAVAVHQGYPLQLVTGFPCWHFHWHRVAGRHGRFPLYVVQLRVLLFAYG